MNNKQYCAITEQGDLGLGAEILSESDQRIMNNKKDTSIKTDNKTNRFDNRYKK